MESERVNVLYFSSFGNFRWGGQKSLFHLVTRLDRTKYRPIVCTPDEDRLAAALREKGIDVVVLGLPKLFHPAVHRVARTLYRLYRLVRQEKIGLVHTDGPRNTLYAGLAARAAGVPLVWHIRSSIGDRHDRFLCALASKVVLVAEGLKQRFSRNGFCRGKFVTIYNGIDLAEFRPLPSRGDIRRAYGIGDDTLLIACTGRVETWKGQKQLIRACGAIAGDLPDFHLLLAGEVAEEDYRRECAELARDLGIGDRVTFAGHQDSVVGMLNETDIFVLPSVYQEAFPRAVIEAMGTGRPVIVSDVGGCAETVENGVSGYLVPPGDAAALGRTIMALGKNKALRADVGRAARRRAEGHFDIRENIRRTESVYREMLEGQLAGEVPAACGLCGGGAFTVLEDGDDPHRVLQCRSCSFVFVHPALALSQLSRHYDENYYEEWIGPQKPRRVKMWNRRLEGIERRRRPGRLLDVGCGTGQFLQIARERGWKIEGTELSPFAARYAAKRTGAAIFCGDLGKAAFAEKSFDVVTIWHVLEHMADPWRCLAEARKILKDDGLLVVAVPNVDDRVNRLVYRIVKGQRLRLFSKDDRELHLCHFSAATLRDLLAQTGFACLSVGPDHGIVEVPKRVVNYLSLLPHRIAGKEWFNALEAFAVPRGKGGAG